MTKRHAPNGTSALEKLYPSRLANSRQMELLGGDLNIDNFHMQLREGTGIEIVSCITAAVVDRTVDGASTLTVTVVDNDNRDIQRSGKLHRRVDVNVDGLFWTLVSFKKTGLSIDLVFEEREVNLLRRHHTPLFADRSKVTRAQFVLRMIREVKEEKIKWCIPELNIKQPISDIQPGTMLVNANDKPVASTQQVQDAITADQTRGKGIHTKTHLTVKGAAATPEQIKNANIILAQADSMHAPKKVKICAMMTAITESRFHNYPRGYPSGTGIYQQNPKYWPATANIATDAAAFIQRCKQLNLTYPNIQEYALCQAVQHSGAGAASNGAANYGPWTKEGIEFVDAYDHTPSAAVSAVVQQGDQTSSKTNMFVRGQITKARGMQSYLLTPENSWNCMQRLASEVNWRAFCVSGTIYFISEKRLWESKPFMVISEDSDGIDWIDSDYDVGKAAATLTVTAHISRWSAPPGSTVQIQDMGPIDGKYLVNDVSRSLYDQIGTITLTKPLPELPEPVQLSGQPAGFGSTPPKGKAKTTPALSNLKVNSIQKKVITYAQSQLGVPYVYGAEQTNIAFDCSGLTAAAYSTAGIMMPHNALLQYRFGKIMSRVAIMEPGDLVFFSTNGKESGIGHVGIYIGNGKMIDAPHTGAHVRIEAYDWGPPEAYYGFSRPWLHGR